MQTPSSNRRWPRRLAAALRGIVVLACLFAVMPAGAAPPASPAQDTPTAPQAQPLAEFLDPDGSLALPAGQAISLDPRGYQLVSGLGEAPRFAPAQPDENPGDENWISGLFGWPGTNGPVYALAVDTAGSLYAGGEFTTAGGVSANGIAKWDGSAWSALGSGVSGEFYPYVYALAVDAAGNLCAGGYFTTAGGVSANRIAKWDGSAWSALGSGMNDRVWVLALDAAGNLYAGGNFTIAGANPSVYLARWTAADGAHNVTIGNYLFYHNNLPVSIHVVTPGTLYRLTLQRFNRSHPQASPDLETDYYWEIVGIDASGSPATGYVVDLTLPTTFTPGASDRVCRYTGSTWDCAASAFTASSITRSGITELSDWAVQDNIACADFDGDGTIDIDDLIAIATRWGQTSGTPGWDGRFDLRPDGRIDIVDIQLTTAQWGQGCAL